MALDNQDGETDKYSYTDFYLSGVYMSKKNKKATAKRIAKAQHRKKQKRKLKLIKTKSKPEHDSFLPPMMSEADAPPEFRAVSMTQAVMEYSKSIFDIKESEDNGDTPLSMDSKTPTTYRIQKIDFVKSRSRFLSSILMPLYQRKCGEVS